MKIKYKNCTDEQRKFIINSVTCRLDRRTAKNKLYIMTKKQLCGGVYRDFVAFYGRGVDIKPNHIKQMVGALNDSRQYIIMSSGSPPGYVCVYGINNPHTDMFKAMECIERAKRTQISTIKSTVLEPAEALSAVGIPAATQNALEARKYIKQIAESQPLENVLNILKGIEQVEYRTKLIPYRDDSAVA